MDNTAHNAMQAVRVNERLLDEARYAAERAHPLLLQSCSPQTRTELSRLAIGIEHIRVINLFYRSHLTCSSWDGLRAMKEDASPGTVHAITLQTDNYISPGVPVMVLRSSFAEGIITASMSTHWSAVALHQLSKHRPLSLRIGNVILTDDNKLLTDNSGKSSLYVVHSAIYPFSVMYSESRSVPLALFLREGVVSLLLSGLLGTVSAIGLWMLAFRRKNPYEKLEDALRKSGIVPWYQPVIDAKTGTIIGVEVLARQVTSDGTVIPPDHFIPVAESSDLIIPLTRALMTQAARELPNLLRNSNHRWHIGVNITQTHVLEAGFVAECLMFIEAFTPGSIILTVELTEREPFDSSPAMLNRLQQLHRNGIAVALDDFGTGYANLEYISEVKVDIIKIDRVFVRRIGQGTSGEHLLTNLINMAGALNLRIIAEGVETEEQTRWLTSNGVSWLQGFLYSPPVPVTQLEQFLVKSLQENKISNRGYENDVSEKNNPQG